MCTTPDCHHPDSLEGKNEEYLLELLKSHAGGFVWRHSVALGELVVVAAPLIGIALSSEEIRKVALWHDIGKLCVPASILLKKGCLTPEEYEIVKKHPEWGYKIASQPHLGLSMVTISVIAGHHFRNITFGNRDLAVENNVNSYPQLYLDTTRGFMKWRGLEFDPSIERIRALFALSDAFEASTAEERENHSGTMAFTCAVERHTILLQNNLYSYLPKVNQALLAAFPAMVIKRQEMLGASLSEKAIR